MPPSMRKPPVGQSTEGTPVDPKAQGDVEPLEAAQTRAAQEQHAKLVAWTKEQFQAMKNARNATERQWYLNLAFYFGKQNVTLLKTQSIGQNLTTQFYIPPAPPYRARPVINRIRPTIRTELAHLTSQKPSASVVPASAEDRDMYAAMAGEQIWDSMYREHKLKAVIRKTMLWTLVCGTGYIKTYWDPAKGKMVDQIEPITGMPTGQKSPEGDLCFTHETPFHVFVPDLREEEIENQPYVMHAQVKSPEWVAMKYKTALDGSEVKPSHSEAGEILEDSFLNMVGTQAMDKQHSVLVLEVWIKPGQLPMFPEGAVFTMVGDKIVQGYQGNPYRHSQYPFAKFDHIPAGKFYSTSVIEDLIPLQREYNRTRGQLIEAKNRMAKPQLLAPKGSINPAQVTTEPGLVIQYTPGFEPPTPLPLSQMPAYVVQEVDRILTDWNDISGQHEVSQGQVPPGVTAATAISFLQERDESKLSHTFDSLEEGIEKVAKQTLSLINQYWTDERVVKVTGPDGSFDAMAFRGSDIDNGQDIRVEAGSALPVSKAAKQALIMDMMKMGFIDPRDGLEVMDMGGINKIYEQLQADQRQVQRENLKMSKVTEQMLEQHNTLNAQKMQQSAMETGDPLSVFGGTMPPIIVPVNTWDNHAMHIELHNRYRKGQAFESLPEYVKTLFETHVQQHIMAMGVETMTMDPRAAVGLPPAEEDEEEEGTPEEGQPPGPEPMPQPMQPEGAPV